MAARPREIQVGRLTLQSTSLISGVVLVVVGIVLVTSGGALVESSTLALAGARAEEWATDLGSFISDEVLALAAVAASGVWLAVRWREPDDSPDSQTQE